MAGKSIVEIDGGLVDRRGAVRVHQRSPGVSLGEPTEALQQLRFIRCLD